ncbi:MAG TPA: hypothetical protein VIW94_09810 [Acidimicrobiia bacterium]
MDMGKELRIIEVEEFDDSVLIETPVPADVAQPVEATPTPAP